MKTVVITGMTCSGKSTLVNYMTENMGFHKIVTCTTRKQRKGEKNGKEYYFISDDKFEFLKREGKFAETAEYDMTTGHVKYGSLIDSYINSGSKNIIILNPIGLKAVRQKTDDIYAVYVRTDEQVLRERVTERGDDAEEFDRRLKADKRDFADIEKYVDLIVDGNMETEEIAEMIIKKLSAN